MNKKAFTLIEMIAAIIIMGIIATTVAVSFKNVMKHNENKRYNEFKRELEQAACVFIDLNVNKTFKDTCYSSGLCNITVEQLIKDGLISEKLKNPRTDSPVDKSTVIEVKWETKASTGAKEKVCTLR
jgi:prepilin-type N-terminal cleavage/methylation domain-containing protein